MSEISMPHTFEDGGVTRQGTEGRSRAKTISGLLYHIFLD